MQDFGDTLESDTEEKKALQKEPLSSAHLEPPQTRGDTEKVWLTGESDHSCREETPFVFAQRAGEGGEAGPPARRDHQPEGEEGGPGSLSPHINNTPCHPPQLGTSTLSALKHTQSNLHLYHMCRKQGGTTKQCPPAGNTMPLCCLLHARQRW